MTNLFGVVVEPVGHSSWEVSGPYELCTIDHRDGGTWEVSWIKDQAKQTLPSATLHYALLYAYQRASGIVR